MSDFMNIIMNRGTKTTETKSDIKKEKEDNPKKETIEKMIKKRKNKLKLNGILLPNENKNNNIPLKNNQQQPLNNEKQQYDEDNEPEDIKKKRNQFPYL